MKICRDCKWRAWNEYVGIFCTRPREAQIDLVTGNNIAPNFDCVEERYNEELCGKEGKFWEAK